MKIFFSKIVIQFFEAVENSRESKNWIKKKN
jgi:hypothetical protein